jgi:hypothetical protein
MLVSESVRPAPEATRQLHCLAHIPRAPLENFYEGEGGSQRRCASAALGRNWVLQFRPAHHCTMVRCCLPTAAKSEAFGQEHPSPATPPCGPN